MHNIHRTAAGFAAVLFTISLALSAPAVHADPIGVQDCAAQGGVYVAVTAADGTAQGGCATKPASGTDALQATGFTITRDASGMICAINNYPNPCPATFDGHYWHYYQASADDAVAGHWTFATAGSDDTKPQAGWVEGWCYSADQDCAPALIQSITPLNTPSTGTGAAPSTPLPWWLLAGIAVAVSVAVVVILFSRRRRNG